MHIHEGARAEENQYRMGAKVDRVQAWLKSWGSEKVKEGHHSLDSHSLHLGGGLAPAELKDMYLIVVYLPRGGTRSLFYPSTIVS